MRRIALCSLLPAIVAGCSSGRCPDVPPRVYEEDVAVSPALLAQVIAHEGTEEACVHACVLEAGRLPEACSFPEGIPEVLDTADTGLSEGIPVHCRSVRHHICLGRDHAIVRGAHAAQGPTPEAAWLAAQAEATSVGAFRALATELRRSGAPASLVARCLSAADDEIRHARILRRLARAAGGVSAPIELGPVPERSLAALAVENTVEGCVRETWAALVNAWQAQHAASAEVRRVVATIVRDGAVHADLAWDLDAWLRSVLRPDEVAAMDPVRRRAVAALMAGVARDRGSPALGLPRGADAVRLAGRLSRALWEPIGQA